MIEINLLPHREARRAADLRQTAGVLALGLWLRFGRRRFVGENIALLLISYPILRATTELFRGDADRGAFGPLSTSQWISIPLLLIGVAMYVRRAKADVAPSTPEPEVAS